MTAADLLERVDDRLRSIVRGVPQDVREDVLQEVRVTVWKVAEKAIEDGVEGDLEGLLVWNGKRAAGRVAQRARSGALPWTGSPSRSGKKDHVGVIEDSLEGFVEAKPEEAENLLPYVDPGFHAAEVHADLFDPITRALLTIDLADREYVFLRFWEDLTAKTASEILGVPQGTLERRWTDRIRPRLRDALEEFAPDVAA